MMASEFQIDRMEAYYQNNTVILTLKGPALIQLIKSVTIISDRTKEGFLRKNIVVVSFFQNCAIHQYS